MNLFSPFLCCLVALSSAAQAEDMQRCVWSCLYGPGKGDPANPAYTACVQKHCVGDQAPESASSSGANPQDPTLQWSAGTAANGLRYAGIDFPGRAGQAGLYVFCSASTGRFIEMVGDDAAIETYIFKVDGKSYQYLFRKGPRGFARAAIKRNDPFPSALASGRNLSIFYNDAIAVASVSLRGSGKALRFVENGCSP